jgi:ribose transport system ATP-binding protein
MKILSGVYDDYEGQIRFNGEPVRFNSIRDAQACGIAIIHQELNLIPYLSITENIFLGREITTRWGTLDKKAMRQTSQKLLDKLKLSISPDTLVAELKVGQQQVVEIAKALLVESEVIIMDEPTSAISESEVAVLFDIITDLRRRTRPLCTSRTSWTNCSPLPTATLFCEMENPSNRVVCRASTTIR